MALSGSPQRNPTFALRQSGKPKVASIPDRISYHQQATLKMNSAMLFQHQKRTGRFILATNELEADSLNAEQALQEYKAQQECERGFRFLKDPLFFAPTVFVKSVERIIALVMIMGLWLPVYNLEQRQMRQALEQTQKTIPNQLKKETQTLTLR